MHVPLLDLKSQYRTIKDRVPEVTRQVFEGQYFILGPRVEAGEKKIAGYCQTDQAVGCASGKDALVSSLMAPVTGPGDRAITALVFVDIDPNIYPISPDKRNPAMAGMGEDGLTTIKTIVPVHQQEQECVAGLGCQADDFPVSEQAANPTLASAICGELTESQQAYVVEKIDGFLNR
ncbi:DegT/DnrJ/EryC1/StrS family aminotransferase [Desulfosarcina sp.]|uniref:DegT/DnrJ/EryC1/StrS family aminotransferase n=1 Tax=Desulfosarcina sp. TaxID=2027861 RepID=UPI00356492BF